MRSGARKRLSRAQPDGEPPVRDVRLLGDDVLGHAAGLHRLADRLRWLYALRRPPDVDRGRPEPRPGGGAQLPGLPGRHRQDVPPAPARLAPDRKASAYTPFSPP